MMSDTTLPSSVEEPPPPARPETPPEERAELLARLRERRRELFAAYANALDPEAPLMPSSLVPFVTVHAAIEACEAEMAAEQWDTGPHRGHDRGTTGD